MDARYKNAVFKALNPAQSSQKVLGVKLSREDQLMPSQVVDATSLTIFTAGEIYTLETV